MITSVKISEDLKYVYWKDERGVHGEKLTKETKDAWIKFASEFNNY